MKSIFNSLTNEEKMFFCGSILYTEPENLIQTLTINNSAICEIFSYDKLKCDRLTFRIAVNKKNRKQNLATKLSDNAIKYCFSLNGVNELFLDIKKKNKIAIYMAKKFNFKKTENLKNQYERYVLKREE